VTHPSPNNERTTPHKWAFPQGGAVKKKRQHEPAGGRTPLYEEVGKSLGKQRFKFWLLPSSNVNGETLGNDCKTGYKPPKNATPGGARLPVEKSLKQEGVT